MSAIALFEDKISPETTEVMRSIQQKHGRDKLANAYTKIQRIANICSRETASDTDVAASILYVFQHIAWALDFEMLGSSKDLTMEQLDKSRDGVPGLVQTALARKALVAFIGTLVIDLEQVAVAKTIAAELEDVLSVFSDYTIYAKTFPSNTPQPAGDPDISESVPPSSGEAFAPPQGQMEGSDSVAAFSKKYNNKVSTQLVEFLYDAMAGSFDDALKTVVKTSGSVNTAKWLDLDCTEFKEIVRLINVHKSVVSSSCAVPGTSTRALQSRRSNEDSGRDDEIRKERSDIWRQAQVLTVQTRWDCLP